MGELEKLKTKSIKDLAIEVLNDFKAEWEKNGKKSKIISFEKNGKKIITEKITDVPYIDMYDIKKIEFTENFGFHKKGAKVEVSIVLLKVFVDKLKVAKEIN
ncbi:MAG TPA: hypothetical protein DCM02_09605 [Flavobacterium sp.]|nr:hypothetical protein [Flavobacterium sp.]